MKYIITTLCLIFFAGGIYSGFYAGRYWTSDHDVKLYHAKAVELGCGGYDSKTAQWVDIEVSLPEIDVKQLTPLPIRKPTPPQRIK